MVHSLLQKSERNLRRALLMLETCRVLQNPMSASQEPQLPDWELYIQVSHLHLSACCGWVLTDIYNGPTLQTHEMIPLCKSAHTATLPVGSRHTARRLCCFALHV